MNIRPLHDRVIVKRNEEVLIMSESDILAIVEA